MGKYWPTWVEINLNNVGHNVRQIKNRVGENVSIMAVIKGNAYGHGTYEVAKVALENGADKLGIATIDEGIELRKKGIKIPILILGHVLEGIQDIVKYDLMQTVFNMDLAKSLSEEAKKLNKTANINIKVNTGMNRIGVEPEDAISLIKEIMGLSNLYLEGIFTHLATSYIEEEFSNLQYKRFSEVIKELEKEGIHIPYKHCCNTGGVLNFPHMYLNQVRPGVLLTTTYPALKEDMNMSIRDSLEFKSKVVYIRKLSKGESIGYNLLYTADENTRIAIVSAGWGDGIPRELSNKGYVLIKGQRCPIRGRVCCDQILVDITHVESVTIGEEVVIIGKQGQEEIVCWEWGKILGGISSPITLRTLITDRVNRIYKEG